MVVGTGRCGTSAVARICADAGVFMGAAVNEHWEDIDFHNLDQWRLAGEIGRDDWRHGIEYLAALRSEPWGFKDTRSAHFLPEYRELLGDGLIFIYCTRPRSEVVASMMRSYGWDEVFATGTAEFREDMLAAHLPERNVLELPLGDLRAGIARQKIEEFLEPWLSSFR